MTGLELAAVAFRVYQYVERLRELNAEREAQRLPTLTEDEFLAHVRDTEAAGQAWLKDRP